MSQRWETILAIDSDRWAAETYRANFPGVRIECAPVANYIDAIPTAEVILGGPLCGGGLGAAGWHGRFSWSFEPAEEVAV